MNVAELLPLETIPVHFKGKNLHSGLFLFWKDERAKANSVL